ncbi:MAG: glutamate racemase [Patescibacteria group bacterium]|nr:glutamate racemase [Patescibacteria group bacterium]
MDTRPIGIFDSGVGGLSVLRDVQKILPQETFLFLADQTGIPYGGKTQKELLDRVSNIFRFFEKKNVKTVIIACNTATVYTLDKMRKRFRVPIIGTVPVVKTAAAMTKSGKVAVLSTPATAKSDYLKRLIGEFANGVDIACIGGTGLEELVDAGITDTPEVEAILKKNLSPLIKNGVDVIALGCTHYPFLQKEIRKVVGPNIAIIDSGEAVARRTKSILEECRILANKKGIDEYYTTADSETFQRVAEKLLGVHLPRAVHVELF